MVRKSSSLSVIAHNLFVNFQFRHMHGIVFNSLNHSTTKRGCGYSHILAIRVRSAGKGMVFKPLIWSGIRPGGTGPVGPAIAGPTF